MKIEDRFIRYTQFDTQSCDESDTVPSTAKQLVFARFLRDEMIEEGLQDVVLTEQGYLYATMPANGVDAASQPVIGFISHYDTSPDCSGANIKAQIVEQGGERIIKTDGTTLLGADDKAGIAEIMQAMCYLRDHPEIQHGIVRVAFNPDEEIGRGADNFDVERFGCDFAYTIDGGDEGELEYENFNAASAQIKIKGFVIHPGYAKGRMLNAARIAAEFSRMMPENETPETTEGYEGFYHLTSLSGTCESAQLTYIIRDHDIKRFEQRKVFMRSMAERINDKYGAGTCSIEIRDQYYNMLNKIEPVMHIVERAKKAMLDAGVTPKVQPIRGGTDGAQLSFKGLPCPNIFTGAIDFHGPDEHVAISVMQKAMMTIVNIVKTP
ncbi:MAG: peptidase T [Prevotella sp.]|nr:peptidase T [Prevotella sp.]